MTLSDFYTLKILYTPNGQMSVNQLLSNLYIFYIVQSEVHEVRLLGQIGELCETLHIYWCSSLLTSI